MHLRGLEKVQVKYVLKKNTAWILIVLYSKINIL